MKRNPRSSAFAHRSSTLLACVVLGLVVAGAHCAPRAAIEGRSCPCADGYECCAAADVCVAAGTKCPLGPTGGVGGVAATPETVARVCNAEHGPALAPPRTAAAFGRFLGRRWYICGYDPSSVSGLVAHEGIELTVDGKWYFLRWNGREYERTSTPGEVTSGSYLIHNDTLNMFVEATDTTPGYDLYVQWSFKGPLDLHIELETSPLRFQTPNGILLHFVALDEDGTSLIGAEGASCEPGNSRCQPGLKCISEKNSERCVRPGPVGLDQGCDRAAGGASCTPPYTCLDTRRCGTAP
jgi:hypothetical protein